MECDKYERVHSNLKINKFLLFSQRGIHTCDRNVYIILLVLSLFPPLRSKIVLATHFLPTSFLFFFPLSLTGGSSDFFSCGLTYLNEKQKIIVSSLKIIQQTRHVCFRFFQSIAFHFDLPCNLRNKMAEK